MVGIVRDSAGRAVIGLTVEVEHEVTRLRREVDTDRFGIFRFRDLPPGCYQLSIRAPSFQSVSMRFVVPGDPSDYDPVTMTITATSDVLVIEPGKIVLHVKQEDSVTVRETSSPLPTSTNGVLEAIFSREAITTLPLTSGRTLQSFVSLTPGIVFTESTGTLAQFTAVGQRRYANRFTIDGMSGDLAVAVGRPGLTEAASGALPAIATLGGMQTLVPLDAVDEIQVRTNSTSPEHARTPGAQTAVVTRSGGNRFTGSVFSDLRPRSWAASDWFTNAGESPRRKPTYWNIGASAGGPIVPKRLFYFAVWEHQRITRPISTTLRVPSIEERESAPADLRQILNVFPLPNGRDVGQGLAQLSREFANVSRLSTLSLRGDAVFSSHRVFVRLNGGRSSGDAVDPILHLPFTSYVNAEAANTGTATVGLNSVFGFATHEVRVNGTRHRGSLVAQPVTNGGAQSLASGLLAPGAQQQDALIGVSVFPASEGTVVAGRLGASRQEQFQVVDTWSVVRGRHQWRWGIDYRYVTAVSEPAADRYAYRFSGISDLLQRRVRLVTVEHSALARAIFHRGAAHIEDVVRMSPRLSLQMGLRYDVAPAPSSGTDLDPLVLDVDALPGVRERRRGSRLWRTQWGNVAPHVSATYHISQIAGREATVRGAFNTTFDELTSPGAIAIGGGYPYSTIRVFGPTAFPVAQELLAAPAPAPFTPADRGEYIAFSDSLRTPRTRSWQIAVEQSTGRAQRFALAYVGASGRDSIYAYRDYLTLLSFANVYVNAGRSDYHALLTEYTRHASRGLMARVTYTWSHAIDLDSGESPISMPPPRYVPLSSNRGSADFDRRHVFQGIVSYQFSDRALPRGLRQTLVGWQLDALLSLQSGAPFSMVGVRDVGFGQFSLRPDVVPDESPWIPDQTAPSGRRLNPAAFEWQTAPRQGTLGRNTLRASPLRQLNLALSRSVPLNGRATARLRLDAFNVLNVSNFAPPYNDLPVLQSGGSTFVGSGRPYLSYADGLGTGTLRQGGLVPIQQLGGPRSIQIGLRFDF